LQFVDNDTNLSSLEEFTDAGSLGLEELADDYLVSSTDLQLHNHKRLSRNLPQSLSYDLSMSVSSSSYNKEEWE
jgi:hypothetical protein